MEKNLWGNLKAIFLQYRWRLAKGLALVIAANVLVISIPLFFRLAVKAMYSPGVGEMQGSYAMPLAIWALSLLALALCAASLKYYMRMTFIAIGRDAECETRSKLFARLQEQSMAFYDRHGIGELLSRLSNDISAYRDVWGRGLCIRCLA